MVRIFSVVLAAAIMLSPAAFAAPAEQPAAATQKRIVAKKRAVTRHWHGYGFLPGYRPPEVVARERWRAL